MSIKIVYREDRSRWQVTYTIQGQRKRPLFALETEALAFARKLERGFAPEDRNAITIAEAGKQYYERESSKKHHKSRHNDKRYINLLYHFMVVEREIERLSSIELEDLEAFRDWLPKQKEYDGRPMNMGASTVKRCLVVLKRVFKKHVQWKNIERSPAHYLDYLETDETPRKIMTVQQYLDAIEKAPIWFRPVFQFIFLTGCPGSCIERLQWSDVDFNERKFFMLRRKGKAGKLRRISVPIGEATFTLLMTLRNQSPQNQGEVFLDDRGKRLLADRISRVGNLAIKEAGIEGVTVYSLRHSLASELTSANVATEIVRQCMGHSSISTTQRYANKLRAKTIEDALDSVRGGKVVAIR